MKAPRKITIQSQRSEGGRMSNKIYSADELLEKFRSGAGHIRELCIKCAEMAEVDGEIATYTKLRDQFPELNQQILDQMLKLGRAPGSATANDFIKLGFDILEAQQRGTA